MPKQPRTPQTDPHCLETRFGRFVNPFEFELADVSIPTMIASLSKLCRFNGHCREFYSVAQHSVHVAERVWELSGRADYAIFALFHDGAEAYLSDLPQPLKRRAELEFYTELDWDIQVVIEARIQQEYNLMLDAECARLTKQADAELLSCEATQLLTSGGRNWVWSVSGRPTFTRSIQPLSPTNSALLFENYFQELREILQEQED